MFDSNEPLEVRMFFFCAMPFNALDTSSDAFVLPFLLLCYPLIEPMLFQHESLWKPKLKICLRRETRT